MGILFRELGIFGENSYIHLKKILDSGYWLWTREVQKRRWSDGTRLYGGDF